MTTERPILFSTAMVQAILSGKKTQTRRLLKPQPAFGIEIEWYPTPGLWAEFHKPNQRGELGQSWHCPYGQPGDRLWVRESCYIAPVGFGRDVDANKTDDKGRARFIDWAASMDGDAVRCATKYGVKKTPSIHMPRWASRLTLEVVSVRVERLQDISEQDVLAEGVETGSEYWYSEFRALWDTINASRAPWASNPWVWVVEFKVVPNA